MLVYLKLKICSHSAKVSVFQQFMLTLLYKQLYFLNPLAKVQPSLWGLLTLLLPRLVEELKWKLSRSAINHKAEIKIYHLLIWNFCLS